MLAADQELLESQMRKQAVTIQNAELSFFVSNLDTAATCASLLAGFSFAALELGDFSGLLADYVPIITCYYAGVSVAFGSNFLCFILALFCRIHGVRLALKGPPGAMKVAVEKMRVYQEWTLKLLQIGLFAFHFSALALAWIQLQQWFVIFLTSLLLLCSAVGTAYLTRVTRESFAIPDGSEVASTFSSERILRGMQQHTFTSQELQPISSGSGNGNGVTGGHGAWNGVNGYQAINQAIPVQQQQQQAVYPHPYAQQQPLSPQKAPAWNGLFGGASNGE